LAVEHVLRSRDLVISIRVAAGTGKTTMMREAVGAIETLSGKEVFVFAPSSSAVDALKREGFVGAETFQQLTASAEMQQAVAKQVLWVDEAGFLSVKQLNWLVRFAGANGCRLIVGRDTRQHHGIERGDRLSLRVLRLSASPDE
jgi:thymidine kinase